VKDRIGPDEPPIITTDATAGENVAVVVTDIFRIHYPIPTTTGLDDCESQVHTDESLAGGGGPDDWETDHFEPGIARQHVNDAALPRCIN
jgi:hypothetical protein